MQIKRSLLFWYLRSASWVTVFALLTVVAYVLLRGEAFYASAWKPWLFIYIHSLLLTKALGDFDTSETAYLYTRGFDRNTLWVHRLLAHVIDVLLVWGSATLIIWLGIRSAVQDHVFKNPYYPIFYWEDYFPPLLWLFGYFVLFGICEYAAVRDFYPTVGRTNGFWILAASFYVGVTILFGVFLSSWQNWLCLGVLSIVTISQLWGASRIHQQVEVRL